VTEFELLTRDNISVYLKRSPNAGRVVTSQDDDRVLPHELLVYPPDDESARPVVINIAESLHLPFPLKVERWLDFGTFEGVCTEDATDVLDEAGAMLDASNAYDIVNGRFVGDDGLEYEVQTCAEIVRCEAGL